MGQISEVLDQGEVCSCGNSHRLVGGKWTTVGESGDGFRKEFQTTARKE